MSYLIMKTASNATPESFQLTSTIDKPRIYVNGSYIPLTTNSGEDGNLKLKIVKNDTTYYAMRTSTSSYSQSASASCLTTNEDGSGLSNTTALTRVSTSNTVYYTAGETTGTTYLTRQSVSGYATRESVSGYGTRESVSGYGTAAWATATYTRASTYETLTRASTYATNYGTATSVTSIRLWGESLSDQWGYYTSITYSWIWDNYYNSTNLYTYWPIATSMTAGSQSAAFNYDATISAPGHPIYATFYDGNYKYSQYNTMFVPWQMLVRASWWGAVKTTATIYLTQESIYGYNTRESIYGYGYGTFTTATYTRASTYVTYTRASTYATLTRASTSGTNYGTRVITTNTVYLTRESTSGYSGVSSSSSSESASGTCWR